MKLKKIATLKYDQEKIDCGGHFLTMLSLQKQLGKH